MAAHESPARIINAEDVTEAWPDALAAVSRRGERVPVQDGGVTVAALVSVQDLVRLARLDDEREERFAAFDRIGAVFADEDPDESDRIAALALEEVREEMRKVTWPTRKMVVTETIVVLVVVVFFTIMIVQLDNLFSFIFNAILFGK